jgi:hypothetical protein
MGKVHDRIDAPLERWMGAQRVFFVGSAPREGGHVNVSPKGPIDTLGVLDYQRPENGRGIDGPPALELP